MKASHTNGLRIARFLMVMGSLSPLFVLWAIRGTHEVIRDDDWIAFCLLGAILPNLVLFVRWRIAWRRNDHRVILVRSAKDQAEHLLVYLFAMLIPLFGVDLEGARDIAAAIVAFIFVVFVFWHMNLHYMNILFALLGYHVFTIEAATSTTGSSTSGVVVISKRPTIAPDTQLDTLRLSDTVLIEKG